MPETRIRKLASGKHCNRPRNAMSGISNENLDEEIESTSLLLKSFFHQNRLQIDKDFQKRQKREKSKEKYSDQKMDPNLDIEVYHPVSMQEEVRGFGLYGSLKRADTEIHNQLPSPEMIERERNYNEFEAVRRSQPHAVMYKPFYRYLTPTLSSHYQLPPLSGKSSTS